VNYPDYIEYLEKKLRRGLENKQKNQHFYRNILSESLDVFKKDKEDCSF